MQYAYFAKHVSGLWVTVATNCSFDDTKFFDEHFTVENNYVRTKIVELD